MTQQAFIELGLTPRVLRAVEALGFEEPTPVQRRAIPLLLAGKDVIVQAQTGSGKTAAYGIPIVETIDPLQPRIQALALTPTRELALQVALHLSQLGQFLNVGVVTVYGGQSYDRQIRAIRHGAQIAVATPGRLLDLVERQAIALDNVRIVTLDEADEMLDMGFLEDVERILRRLPPGRQTALFSATMPQAIRRLASTYLREPEQVILSQPRAPVTVPTVEQSYYVAPRPFKTEALLRLLDMASPQLALVFCATRQMTSDLAQELQGRGYRAEALHGDMAQAHRESVMEAVRAGRVEILIATDVAARGLDIPEVSHVFNFDIPQDPDRYVHRIGRTARAGRAGEAMTLIAPRESSMLRTIEQAIGTRIQRRELPTVAALEDKERARLVSQLEQTIAASQGNAFRPLVENLAQRHDVLDLAAAALSLAFGPSKARPEIPQTAWEPPRRRPGRAPAKTRASSPMKNRPERRRRKSARARP